MGSGDPRLDIIRRLSNVLLKASCTVRRFDWFLVILSVSDGEVTLAPTVLIPEAQLICFWKMVLITSVHTYDGVSSRLCEMSTKVLRSTFKEGTHLEVEWSCHDGS